MRGLTNKVDQNIIDLKGNFIFSARHVTILIRMHVII